MLVFPAIDLMDGTAVRLEQGRRESVKVYDRAPWEVAARFAAAGATRMHVVDLDAAFTRGSAERKDNRATIARIAAAAGVEVEAGGGVRSLDDCAALFDAGVAAGGARHGGDRRIRRWSRRRARAGRGGSWSRSTRARARSRSRAGPRPPAPTPSTSAWRSRARARRRCSTPTSRATACAAAPTWTRRRGWRGSCPLPGHRVGRRRRGSRIWTRWRRRAPRRWSSARRCTSRCSPSSRRSRASRAQSR